MSNDDNALSAGIYERGSADGRYRLSAAGLRWYLRWLPDVIGELVARAELAEAEAAALTARVAELEEHLTGDIQAVTSDGQQHRIRRGNWRPYPASLLE